MSWSVWIPPLEDDSVTPAETAKWDFQSDGQLKTHALLEWGVASMPPRRIILRVGYAISQGEWDVYQRSDRSPHQIQAAMSSIAAKELAAQLLVYAELLDLERPLETAPNS